MAKKYKHTDKELGAICRREIERADGADGDLLAQHIIDALDYYYNRPRGDEKAGESQVQSTDLADMTNAILAQLTPMISTDALIEFEADGEEDEDQARMESRFINDCVIDKNQGYLELQSCLKDAALCRNTFAKVWADDVVTSETRSFANIDKTRANQIIKVLGELPSQEVTSQDFANGTLSVTIAISQRKFRWRAIDPGEFVYQGGWEHQDLQEIRFCAERDTPTRSDLLEDGYDAELVDQLPKQSSETRLVRQARDQQLTRPLNQPQTRDQERVERHECYLLIDMDDDGISERWKVIVGNKQTVLEKEQVSWVPYCTGSLYISPHRLQGEDLYDHMRETQDIKTAAKRRWLDCIYNSVWSRLAAQENNVDPSVDDARAGATIWTKGRPMDSLMPVTGADVGPTIQAVLDYEDRHRTERGGAALDVQSAEAQIVGESGVALEKQYSVKEAMTQMFARNIAETLIRNIYLLMHRTLRTFAEGPMKSKLRNKQIQVDPTTWPIRTSLNVTPGLTPQARTAVGQAMLILMQDQAQATAMGLGGQLVSLDNMYRTRLDFLRAKGVQNCEQYLTDPSSDEARMAAQQSQEQQAALAQQQQQLLAMQIQLEERKLALEKYKADQSTYADIYKADLQADLKETELTTEGIQARRDADDRARASAAETAAAAANQAGGGNGRAAG